MGKQADDQPVPKHEGALLLSEGAGSVCFVHKAAAKLTEFIRTIVRRRRADALDPWLEQAKSSLVASFANGVLKDKAAVAAAIISPWSNGQTEGQITKIKLVKRQMHGRGKLDLLQARVIGAA
jgi:transposase